MRHSRTQPRQEGLNWERAGDVKACASGTEPIISIIANLDFDTIHFPPSHCTPHTLFASSDDVADSESDGWHHQIDEDVLAKKMPMSLLDLRNKHEPCDLTPHALGAQASLEIAFQFEPVVRVESVEDDSDSDEEDDLPPSVVRYDLSQHHRPPQRSHHTEIDTVSRDRLIGSPSYRTIPRHYGFRSETERRSDEIQMRARLHAVQQLCSQAQIPARERQEELGHPEPQKCRPSVLSGLGRSSPLRNSWTLVDL